MLRRYHEDEAGVALVFAMLAVIILSGLAVLFVARAVTESRATGNERDFESAVHVAEAGVDDVITVLNADETYVTTDPATGDRHEFTVPLNASEAQQRDWAIEVARTSCGTGVATDASGITCGIRPFKTGVGELPFIFGVGFVPNMDTPSSTRVVKVRFDKGLFSPSKAILTNGALEVGGNLNVGGDNGALHTNADLRIVGGSVTTTGPVTATGTISGSCGAPSCGPASSVDQEERIQPVSAIQIYRNAAPRDAHTLRDDLGNYVGDWFDLCPDGTVRIPTVDATTTPATPRPCATTAEILWRDGDTGSYNGWDFTPSGWSVGGSPVRDGVYYVYEKNADVGGAIAKKKATGEPDPVRLTILADASGDINEGRIPDTGTTCTAFAGDESGSIKMTGLGAGTDVKMEPFIPNLLLVADRDIQMHGNNRTAVTGVMAAHEQVGISGTPSIKGSIVAEDACPDTARSPVHANTVSGNFELLYDGNAPIPFDSLVRITAWNEFSARL